MKTTLIFLMFGYMTLVFTSCSKDDEVKPFGIVDGSGNKYSFVTIGTQDWLVENLHTTKYNNGTSIPLVTDTAAWAELTTPGYCWYDNDEATYGATYGAFYNWYAVNTGNLCPTGWHVPTDDEWTTLSEFLGAEIAGGKLKEADTTHWRSPNFGATNETGFTALPGGQRLVFSNNTRSEFRRIGELSIWWNATNRSDNIAMNRYIFNKNIQIKRWTSRKKSGLSVRCVRE